MPRAAVTSDDARRQLTARGVEQDRWLIGLVAVQIVAIVCVACLTVWRYPFLGLDEGAHVSYVATIAVEHRLPSLRDPSARPVQELDQSAHRRRPRLPANRDDLAGENYEAFQPPLYYLLAAPVFSIPRAFEDKIRAVRLLDAVLLLCCIPLLAQIARVVFRERWLLPLCASLTVLLWPGVVTQSVTVTNAALALPMALLFVLACSRASSRASTTGLLWCAAALGGCALTSLTLLALAPLLLVPIHALARRRGFRVTVPAACGAAVVPVAMLTPWLVMNLNRYGALTADRLMKAQQMSTINPTHETYGLDYILSGRHGLSHAFLPQQWWADYMTSRTATLLSAIAWLLLGCALVAAVARSAHGEWRPTALLATPWVTGVMLLVTASIVDHGPCSCRATSTPNTWCSGSRPSLRHSQAAAPDVFRWASRSPRSHSSS